MSTSIPQSSTAFCLGRPVGLHALLGERGLQESLRSMVRRRIPAQDVDDVLQSVLCDALASAHVPTEPAEIPRWVTGIARNKIADFHRRAFRERATDVVEARAPFEPVEERDLLVRLGEEEAKGSAAETLDWVVREWSGEPLTDIAEEVALPADVVRQRVSRLRRRLRAKWLLPLLGVALALGALRGLTGRDVDLPPEARHLSPLRPHLREAAAPTLDGIWSVAEVLDTDGLTPEVRAWVLAQSVLATVEVRGDWVTLVTSNGERGRAIHLERLADGRFVGETTDASGRTIPIAVSLTNGGAVVRSESGPLPIAVRLVRR